MEEETRQEYLKRFFEDVFDKYLTTKYEQPTGPGHPKLFKTPKDLAKVAVKYFIGAEDRGESLRLTRFLIVSKIIYRHILDDYKNYKPSDFGEVVALIKLFIEDYNMDQLYSMNMQGAKFALQCGFGNYVPTERQIIEQKDFVVNIGQDTVTNDENYDDEESRDTEISS